MSEVVLTSSLTTVSETNMIHDGNTGTCFQFPFDTQTTFMQGYSAAWTGSVSRDISVRLYVGSDSLVSAFQPLHVYMELPSGGKLVIPCSHTPMASYIRADCPCHKNPCALMLYHGKTDVPGAWEICDIEPDV